MSKQQKLEQLGIENLIKVGSALHLKVKDFRKKNPEYDTWSEKRKRAYFSEMPDFVDFVKDYPITARYIICLGQYSARAFRRMLDKTRRMMANLPPSDKRPKGYMEDEWIKRQADYVRYLWEDYQGKHVDLVSGGSKIWNETYKKLREEFDDFRNNYEETKKSVEAERKELDAANALAVFKRVAKDPGQVSEEELAGIVDELKRRLVKKHFKAVLQQLLRTVKAIAPTAQGRGLSTSDEDKPTVKMIEYVDEERYDEVPQQYKLY
jgi:hypothetical protein